MSDTKTQPTIVWNDYKMFAYIFGTMAVLHFVFKYLLGFSFPIRFGLNALITALGLYPLFIRGTENRWTKGKREWTFLSWVAISILTASFFFLIAHFLKDKF